MHRVRCVICGKESRVRIENRTGKILDKRWGYWGKINMSRIAMSKYLYKVVFDKDGKIASDTHGNIKTIKVANEKYNPKAKPAFMEYWECAKCFGT